MVAVRLLSFSLTVWLISGKDLVSISSSCNDKEVNGLYYIKPTDNGAVIPVICNNGYTMLDASLNFDQVSTYFTSLYHYGTDDKILYGTDCSDSAGWSEWFIPANDNTKFRVAKGCLECEGGEQHGDNTGYYMTNGYFCPINLDIDGCSAEKDMTGQTEPDVMCNVCDDTDALCGTSDGYSGKSIKNWDDLSWCDCWSLQLPADVKTVKVHSQYCQSDLNWRPSFVIDRSQCTCYKPQESENKVYKIDASQLPAVSSDYKDDIETLGLYIHDLITWDEEDDSVDVKQCRKTYTYLSNADFKKGTYRITECGHYVLTEDILIHFNKPLNGFNYDKGDSPNAYNLDNLHWYPTVEQQESGEYFGVDAMWGPFSTGFFAGISIETDHVWIDLGGFEMAMDREYYLQQRFFAIIELGNKQFEAKQGPVDYGRDDIKLKDLSISNGILGLSSHHGIHGTESQVISISDLKIRHFDTHGIQCNGCKHMTIENIEIGPQNDNIPVLGRYVHARMVLTRIRYFVEEFGEYPVPLANRKEVRTVKELADRLVEQMDMIYYHVVQGIEFADDDEQWIHAKKTFLNPTGWLDGGSSYGILLNGQGTGVVNVGRRYTNTYDISVKNVYIHDLKLKPRENFWAQTNVLEDEGDSMIVHGFFFETLDWNNGDIYDEETGYYLGDAYTDILFAANRFLRSDFCPLGSLFYLDGLSAWAYNDGASIYDLPDVNNRDLEFMCGSDIQSHSTKGAMGIRIDGTKNFVIQDVQIENLVNWGDLGSDACGEYEGITFATGFETDPDLQYGYTGNNVHGIYTDYASGKITDVQISNLKSWYGSAIALSVNKGVTVALHGDIEVGMIVAGSKVTEEMSNNLILPNSPPFVCSIFIGPNSDSDTTPENDPVIKLGDDFNVKVTTDIYGYDYCTASSRVGEMITPKSPENVELSADGFVIMNENIIGSNFHAVMAIFIFSVIVVFMLCLKRKICDSPGKDIGKLANDGANNYGSI